MAFTTKMIMPAGNKNIAAIPNRYTALPLMVFSQRDSLQKSKVVLKPGFLQNV